MNPIILSNILMIFLITKFKEFKHRTFNHFDLHFFLERLKYLYKKYSSLECIFAPAFKTSTNAYEPIIAFRNIFLGEYLDVRTRSTLQIHQEDQLLKD